MYSKISGSWTHTERHTGTDGMMYVKHNASTTIIMAMEAYKLWFVKCQKYVRSSLTWSNSRKVDQLNETEDLPGDNHSRFVYSHFIYFFQQGSNISNVYLTKTFLPGPDRRVNDLQEKLTSARVEDEDGSVDWLRCQVAFKRLKTNYCHVVHYHSRQSSQRNEKAQWPLQSRI